MTSYIPYVFGYFDGTNEPNLLALKPYSSVENFNYLKIEDIETLKLIVHKK